MYDYYKTLSNQGKVKFIANILLGVIGVVFATLNWTSQEIHMVFFKARAPLSLLIIFSMIAGYAVSSLVNYRKFQDKEKEIEKLRKELEENDSI
jgi:uncharacterized integral membrane protein